MSNKKKILAILVITMLIMININNVFAKTGTVITETLRVRKAPSTNSTILEMLNQGDKIEIEGEEGDWYKVTVNNKKGYVSKEYIKITNETSTTSPKPSQQTTTTPSTTPVVQPSNTPIPTPSSTPVVMPTNTTEESPEPKETPSQSTDSNPEEPVIETQKILGDKTNREIHVYIIPNFSSIKISKINKDKKVTIKKTLGNWSKVSSDNSEGWIPNSAIMIEVKN